MLREGSRDIQEEARDIREEPSMWRLSSATYRKVLMAGRHQGIEGRQAKQDSHGCSILMGGRRQGGTGEGCQ